MTEPYPGADRDEKDGYIHDTVPAQRSQASNLESIRELMLRTDSKGQKYSYVNHATLSAWADERDEHMQLMTDAVEHVETANKEMVYAVLKFDRLYSFIELCRDTFADFEKANRIIGRSLQADAAKAGYDACVKCLAGETAP